MAVFALAGLKENGQNIKRDEGDSEQERQSG